MAINPIWPTRIGSDANAPTYCVSCKRRQSYATCKTCLKPVCAICAWTKDNSYKGDDSFRTEVCRGCR
jgi:hypothetical protein